MITYPANTVESSVYPGQFISPAGTDGLRTETGKATKKKYHKAIISISELQDTYKLEMDVPVKRREDIILYAENSSLFISLTYPKAGEHVYHKNIAPAACELTTDIYYYQLPENVAPEFASAEFSKGTLTMHIPKDPSPLRIRSTRIVVY